MYKFFFIITLLITLVIFGCKIDKDEITTFRKEHKEKQTTNTILNKYKLRKYSHVKEFYSDLSESATKICLENNIPPASLLAIAGLESGWNRGYIGQITGNILSLNAKKSDKELPALRLPRVIKTKKIIFDKYEIEKYDSSEIVYENRPKSFKKDYRPEPYAGTNNNLAYFKYHPKEKAKAHAQNIEDFVTTFISRTSRIKAYSSSRAIMDSLVAKYGKNILLKEETAILFIHSIGGKRNSYNSRASWPKKTIRIMYQVGLIDLTKDISEGNSFENSWNKKEATNTNS